MKIPNLTSTPVVEKKPDGNYYFTSYAQQLFAQLFKEMQDNLSDEGFKPPKQPTATIVQLNTALSTGAILYDSKTDEFKGNVAGTFKTFTLT